MNTTPFLPRRFYHAVFTTPFLLRRFYYAVFTTPFLLRVYGMVLEFFEAGTS